MKRWAVLGLALALALGGCQKASDAAFGARVRAYLLEHPEVLQEAYGKLQEKQEAQRLADATANIKTHRKALENDPRDFVANPNGKVTVVEFFDFNCGYCKLIAPQVLDIVKTDPGVRVVFKDLTIFGEASEYAAAGAELAKKNGRYLQVHRQFMAEKPLDDAGVARILTANGISPDAARKRQESAEQQKYLADQHALAASLGIEGTPAFIIGDTMVPGADPEALKAAIAKAKKG
ncbi:MAG TPA: DsbA family protein [Caulobacteraceae bacterium]